jgi:hypothetical protein
MFRCIGCGRNRKHAEITWQNVPLLCRDCSRVTYLYVGVIAALLVLERPNIVKESMDQMSKSLAALMDDGAA